MPGPSLSHFNFIRFILFYFIYIWFCISCVQETSYDRGLCRIPWSWSYRRLVEKPTLVPNIGTGNWTQVFWKRKMCTYSLSHIPRHPFLFPCSAHGEIILYNHVRRHEVFRSISPLGGTWGLTQHVSHRASTHYAVSLAHSGWKFIWKLTLSQFGTSVIII